MAVAADSRRRIGMRSHTVELLHPEARTLSNMVIAQHKWSKNVVAIGSAQRGHIWFRKRDRNLFRQTWPCFGSSKTRSYLVLKNVTVFGS